MKPLYIATACLASVVLGYATDIAGLVSLGTLLVSCWLLIAGAFVYLIWAFFSSIRILKRKPSTILFLAPILVAAFGASGLLGNLLSTRPALRQENLGTESEELRYMFEMDQSDRFSGRFIVLPSRDLVRLTRTREIVRRHSDDLPAETKYHAAMILQHGESPSDFESAYSLASSASQSGFVEAKKLSEAAYDRWQLSIGQPQRYGTQSKVNIGIFGIKSEHSKTVQ